MHSFRYPMHDITHNETTICKLCWFQLALPLSWRLHDTHAMHEGTEMDILLVHIYISLGTK